MTTRAKRGLRWAAAVGTALVMLCLGAGPLLRQKEPQPAEGPQPGGLWAVACLRPYQPKLLLPGEINCPRQDKIMSHYRWWTGIKWMAPEGSRVEEGEVVALVFHEVVEMIAGQARRTALQKRARVESREEREKLREIKMQQQAREAHRALREAEYTLLCMEAGPLPEQIEEAELTVEEARLRVTAAQKAVRRLEAADGRVPVSEERRTELRHECQIAVSDLQLAEAELAALQRGTPELELLAQRARVAAARAEVESVNGNAEAARAREAADTAALRREAAELQADADKWQDRLRTMKRRAGMSGLLLWQYPPGTASISPRVIATVLDPSAPVFVGQATEQQVARIQPGQVCDVLLPSMGGDPLTAEVVGIAVTGEDLSYKQHYAENEESRPARVTVYDVLIQVRTERRGALCQGMTGHAVIHVAEQQERLVVPSACVCRGDSGAFVLVQSGTGFAPRKVKLGAEDERYVVVTSGLEPGQKVAFPAM